MASKIFLASILNVNDLQQFKDEIGMPCKWKPFTLSVKEQGIIPQYLSSHALFKQAPLLPISCSVMDTYL